MTISRRSVPHRHYFILLYPLEDESHRLALNHIIKHYQYAFITHNQDLDSSDKLKKSHIHCLVSFPNARHLSAVSKELNISDNYLQPCNSFNNSLYYLIHFNEPTKYQYSIDEVIGPLKPKLIKLINYSKLEEEEVLTDLFNYIDSHHYLYFKTLCFYILEKGYWRFFKSNRFIISNYLDEHNNHVGM